MNCRHKCDFFPVSTKCHFIVANSDNHKNLCLVLSKGRNGSRSWATVTVLEDNWLGKPKNITSLYDSTGLESWVVLLWWMNQYSSHLTTLEILRIWLWFYKTLTCLCLWKSAIPDIAVRTVWHVPCDSQFNILAVYNDIINYASKPCQAIKSLCYPSVVMFCYGWQSIRGS